MHRDGAGMVPNPEYDPDLARAPLSHVPAVVAVALELWTTDSGYTFDNILITTVRPNLPSHGSYDRCLADEKYCFVG